MSAAVSLDRSYEIVQALKAALDNGGFWVQAQERDGLDTERLTVSFGGDDGDWFVLYAEFEIQEKS